MKTFDSSHQGLSVATLGVAAGPAIRGTETGISTAIVVDDVHYMVDFGLGSTRAAKEAGLHGEKCKAVFITHLHSDHVIDLPSMLLWNWGKQVQGFVDPVKIIGPGRDSNVLEGSLAGTKEFIDSTFNAFSYDLHIRKADEGRPELSELVAASEVNLDGVVDGDIIPVYADDKVRVTATLVNHPPVFPAFAFRFDTAYGSVVISGDTAESENLVRLAQGADLLIHEAVNLEFYRSNGYSGAFLQHQEKSHTPPNVAGRVAAKADVKALVLSHLAGPAEPEFWSREAATEFTGPVTTATSGMIIPIQQQTLIRRIG